MLLAVNQNLSYTCGGLGFSFSGMIPYLVHTLILIIEIAVPVLLVVYGMLDLGKAVVAAKEDEIKKGQQLLIKRVVSALIVFLVIFIVKTVIGFISGGNSDVMGCFDCMINNDSCVQSK